MSDYVFANNAVTTLGSTLGSSATTLTVASGTGSEFPTPTPGQIVPLTIIASGSSTGIPNEIVYATARVGDTFTVVRGQEGTTAQSWSVGDVVANMATAAFYNQQATQTQIQKQAGNYAVDTGAANAGTAAFSPSFPTLSSLVGVPLRIKKMNANNSGAYTLNVNGLGAQSVTLNGRPLVSDQLPAGQIYEVTWDGTNFELLSMADKISNPQLAVMPNNTVKGNISGSSSTPQDLPASSLLALLGFGGQSLSTNGYYKLPGGLIVQWGRTSNIYAEGSLSVAFPIAFPNSCLNAIATVSIPSYTNFYDQGAQVVGTPGTTSMTLALQIYDGSGHTFPVTIFWMAIGY